MQAEAGKEIRSAGYHTQPARVHAGGLLSIATPSFVKARESSRRRACISNLQKTDGAKEQFALEARLLNGANVHLTHDLVARGYLKRRPACPSGGSYWASKVGQESACSIRGHDYDEN